MSPLYGVSRGAFIAPPLYGLSVSSQISRPSLEARLCTHQHQHKLICSAPKRPPINLLTFFLPPEQLRRHLGLILVLQPATDLLLSAQAGLHFLESNR